MVGYGLTVHQGELIAVGRFSAADDLTCYNIAAWWEGPFDDIDGDGFHDTLDNCAAAYNPLQTDTDSDGDGDICDNDDDNDGFPDSTDPYPFDSYACGDSDGDGCDDCSIGVDGPGPLPDSDPLNDGPDLDNDGLCDLGDPCTDSDGDGYGDPGFPNLCDTDNCPDTANPEQDDLDADGVGDICDNCLETANQDQINSDADSLGDACDNCPDVPNPDQADFDHDDIGDICDDICCGVSGDLDHNQTGPDIADLVFLVAYMFTGGPEPPCMGEGDANGDGSPTPDIADLVYIVAYMFSGGPAPVACP